MTFDFENNKPINKTVSLSGLALLILFFVPSIEFSFANLFTEEFSFCDLGAGSFENISIPASYLLFLFAFEVAISGAELPRLSLVCGIGYFITSIGMYFYAKHCVEDYYNNWAEVTPAFTFILQLIISCAIIGALTYPTIKNALERMKRRKNPQANNSML